MDYFLDTIIKRILKNITTVNISHIQSMNSKNNDGNFFTFSLYIGFFKRTFGHSSTLLNIFSKRRFAFTNSGVSCKIVRIAIPIQAIPAPIQKANLQLNP